MSPLFRAPILLLLIVVSYPGEAAPQDHPSTEVGVEQSYEWLTGGREPWLQTTVRATHRRSVRDLVQVRLLRADRFGRADHEAGAVGSLGLGDRWLAGFRGSVAADPSFLPRASFGGRLHRSLPEAWGAEIGVQHRWYPETGITLVHAGAERYWSRYRWAYRVTGARTAESASGFGHLLQLHRFHGPRSHTALGLSLGREAEAVGAGEVVLLETLGVSAWGVAQVTEAFDASYGAWWSRHGDLFSRLGVRAGIAARF